MPESRKSAILEQLLAHIGSLRAHTQTVEQSLSAELAQIHPPYQPSAKNLLHYLALRQHDLRELQGQLSYLGLSSLCTNCPCLACNHPPRNHVTAPDMSLLGGARASSSTKRSLPKPG